VTGERLQEIDLTYLRVCREYAKLSRCQSRKVGAMIVTSDFTPIAMGFNGPSRGVKHCDSCPRHVPGRDKSLSTCPAVHAEVNALLSSSRTNNSTIGCGLYIWPLGPCKDCAAAIINAGIKRLVFPQVDWYDKLGPEILAQVADIEIVRYKPELLD
jgi:dCMP deaminase